MLLNRQSERNLLYRGRKPLARTKLKYERCFADNIFFWNVPENDGTVSQGFLSSLHRQGGVIGTPKIQDGLLTSTGSEAVIINKQLVLNQSSNTSLFQTIDGIEELTSDIPYTYIIKAYIGSYVSQGSGFNCLLSFGGTKSFIGVNSSNQLYVYVNGTGNNYGTVISGGIHTIAVVNNGTTGYAVLDGVKLSNFTVGTRTISSTAKVSLGGDYTDANRDLTCIIDWAGAWFGELSLAEIRSITFDPYQALYPVADASRILYEIAGASGGGGGDVLNRGMSGITFGVVASQGGGYSGLHGIETGYIS